MSRTDPQGSSPFILRYQRALKSRLREIAVRVKAEAPQRLVANPTFAFNASQYDFPIDATKSTEFMRWLREMIDLELFDTESGVFDESALWANQFIKQSHKAAGAKAAARANAGGQILAGGDLFGISAVFGPVAAGVSQKSLAMLYMRNFELLKDISADASQQISKILADGYVNGLSSLTIAREMAASVDSISAVRAERIARTEIVRAYAEGTLDMFEALGIPGVTAKVEFMTMGDNLVCPRCMVLNEKVFTVEEARGKIPVHPNCRCDWLPVVKVPE